MAENYNLENNVNKNLTTVGDLLSRIPPVSQEELIVLSEQIRLQGTRGFVFAYNSTKK